MTTAAVFDMHPQDYQRAVEESRSLTVRRARLNGTGIIRSQDAIAVVGSDGRARIAVTLEGAYRLATELAACIDGYLSPDSPSSPADVVFSSTTPEEA